MLSPQNDTACLRATGWQCLRKIKHRDDCSSWSGYYVALLLLLYRAFMWVLQYLRYQPGREGTGCGSKAVTLCPGRECTEKGPRQLVLQKMWQPIRANATLICVSSQPNLYLLPWGELACPRVLSVPGWKEIKKKKKDEQNKKLCQWQTHPFLKG